MIWQGKTVAILASGPSMSAAIVDAVRAAGILSIVINCTWRLMPDAPVMLASDPRWWLARDPRVSPLPEEFLGERLMCAQDARIKGVKFVEPCGLSGSNGGNGALHAAAEAGRRGAARVLLFGVDLRDDALTRWHGLYRGLNNPKLATFARARRAWAKFARKPDRPEVINCNPDSAVECFPKMAPDDALDIERECGTDDAPRRLIGSLMTMQIANGCA